MNLRRIISVAIFSAILTTGVMSAAAKLPMDNAVALGITAAAAPSAVQTPSSAGKMIDAINKQKLPLATAQTIPHATLAASVLGSYLLDLPLTLEDYTGFQPLRASIANALGALTDFMHQTVWGPTYDGFIESSLDALPANPNNNFRRAVLTTAYLAHVKRRTNPYCVPSSHCLMNINWFRDPNSSFVYNTLKQPASCGSASSTLLDIIANYAGKDTMFYALIRGLDMGYPLTRSIYELVEIELNTRHERGFLPTDVCTLLTSDLRRIVIDSVMTAEATDLACQPHLTAALTHAQEYRTQTTPTGISFTNNPRQILGNKYRYGNTAHNNTCGFDALGYLYVTRGRNLGETIFKRTSRGQAFSQILGNLHQPTVAQFCLAKLGWAEFDGQHKETTIGAPLNEAVLMVISAGHNLPSWVHAQEQMQVEIKRLNSFDAQPPKTPDNRTQRASLVEEIQHKAYIHYAQVLIDLLPPLGVSGTKKSHPTMSLDFVRTKITEPLKDKMLRDLGASAAKDDKAKEDNAEITYGGACLGEPTFTGPKGNNEDVVHVLAFLNGEGIQPSFRNTVARHALGHSDSTGDAPKNLFHVSPLYFIAIMAHTAWGDPSERAMKAFYDNILALYRRHELDRSNRTIIKFFADIRDEFLKHFNAKVQKHLDWKPWQDHLVWCFDDITKYANGAAELHRKTGKAEKPIVELNMGRQSLASHMVGAYVYETMNWIFGGAIFTPMRSMMNARGTHYETLLEDINDASVHPTIRLMRHYRLAQKLTNNLKLQVLDGDTNALPCLEAIPFELTGIPKGFEMKPFTPFLAEVPKLRQIPIADYAAAQQAVEAGNMDNELLEQLSSLNASMQAQITVYRSTHSTFSAEQIQIAIACIKSQRPSQAGK